MVKVLLIDNALAVVLIGCSNSALGMGGGGSVAMADFVQSSSVNYLICPEQHWSIQSKRQQDKFQDQVDYHENLN